MEVNRTKEALENAQHKEQQAQAAVDDPHYISTNASMVTTSTRERRTNSRIDYAQVVHQRPVIRATPDLVAALDKAREVTAEKEAAFESATFKLNTFLCENYSTYEDFVDLGKETVRPMINHYVKNFVTPEGDYKTLTCAYKAARVLNPLVASAMTKEEMIDAINDLKHFKFDEFRPGHGILDQMIAEIPDYVRVLHSTSESFWSLVEGAAEYDKAHQKKFEKDGGGIFQNMWKHDRIEKSRRVWEWWRAKHVQLEFFSIAARLVALVQISTSSVERIFSIVKRVIEMTGCNALEDNIETRLMEIFNDYE